MLFQRFQDNVDMISCAMFLFCKSEYGGIPWRVSSVAFSKLTLATLFISDKLLANSNIEAAPLSLFSRLLVSMFKLKRLLLFDSLYGLTLVWFKLEVDEINKVSPGTVVSENNRMIANVPISNLELNYILPRIIRTCYYTLFQIFERVIFFYIQVTSIIQKHTSEVEPILLF